MKESDKTLFLLSHIIRASVTDIMYHIYSSKQAANNLLSDYYIIQDYDFSYSDVDDILWRVGTGNRLNIKKERQYYATFDEALDWCIRHWIKNK